jgi:hypothetical protein
MLGWSSVQAQQVFIPPSPDYGQIPTVDEAAANPIGSLAGALMARLFSLNPYPLHAGPVQFHPHLAYQFQYGNGVLVNSGGEQQTTALNTISPGLGMQAGPNWFADLSVNFNQYSNPDFRDNVGYAFSLGGRIPFEEWTVSVGYNGSYTDDSQVQTATQTRQINNSLVASGVRRFTSRISLELSGAQNIQLAEEFNNQWTWSTLDWINYQITPRTSVGIGVGAGYNLIRQAGTNSFRAASSAGSSALYPDSVYEQVMGRVSWFPASKLSFQVNGGVQFQQFLDSTGADNGIFPLFGAAIVYHPVTPTLLSFNASHSVGNSYYAAQFTESTSVAIGLNQRLFQRFYLSIQPAYTFTQYKGTFGNLPVTSEEDYFYIYVGLGTTLFKKLATSVFYQYKDNQSSVPGFSFNGSLVGFNLTWRY